VLTGGNTNYGRDDFLQLVSKFVKPAHAVQHFLIRPAKPLAAHEHLQAATDQVGRDGLDGALPALSL
jgi:hypothetical protein